MTVKYDVPGTKRKELAKAVGAWLDCEVVYKGAPTFAYQVDYITIDRNGNLIFDDRSDSEVIEGLLEHLNHEGFVFESEDGAEDQEQIGLTVSVPIEEVNVDNLKNLLTAKGRLIEKALSIESVSFEITEDTVCFPWFLALPDSDSVSAYSHFISALCKMSKEQKRISPTEKEVTNEKYAFRCFLLRLGFIGNEYKAERKILLRNLSGSSAFKNGIKNESKPVCSE